MEAGSDLQGGCHRIPQRSHRQDDDLVGPEVQVRLQAHRREVAAQVRQRSEVPRRVMMIEFSYELTKLITDKMAKSENPTSFAKQLKGMANSRISNFSERKILAIYEFAREAGHLVSFEATLVHCNNTTLAFNMKPELVRELINSIVVKKPTPTSEKVFVKMVASRILKLFSVIEHNNVNEAAYYKIDTENWERLPDEKKLTIPKPQSYDTKKPEFRTVIGFKTALDSLINLSRHSYEFTMIRNQFENELFKRPELTDAIVSQAMDYVITHEVMES